MYFFTKVAVGALLPIVAAVDRTGSFSTQPYAANPVMQFEGFDFHGEGIAYDTVRDQVLLGTLSNPGSTVAGSIYAVPYVNPTLFAEDADAKVVYTEDDMMLIFTGNEDILSIAGLEMDPSDSDVVWAATSYYPPDATTPCGIAKIKISTGDLMDYHDLTTHRSTSNNGACMPNDIVFDDAGNLYATDFYGYQVWKIALSTDSAISVVSNDVTYLCNENSGVCPPDEQDTYSVNGPNGIEYVNDKLIVAVSTNRMVLIDLASNGSEAVVISQFPADGIQGCDGIIFDAAKERLYIAGFGTEGSVQVATSTDDWTTMTVHTAFAASCVNDGTTTLAIASNSDVMAFCSNNFGAAPYAISVLSGVVSGGAGEHFSMAQSSNFDSSATKPEGIEYDKNLNKVVISSMGSGDISGLPPSLTGATVSSNSIHTYDSGDSTVYGTVGLHIDREDVTGCSMYACVGDALGDTSIPGGLAYYNLCTGERLNYISFAGIMLNGEQLINDVVIRDSSRAYITDIDQIIYVDQPYKSDAVPKTFIESVCVSPNGIELYNNDYLLVACDDAIYRVNIDNKDVIKVADFSGAITYVDGMFFDAAQEILYVAMLNDRIAALSSNDDWKTLDILYVFTAGCSTSRPGTITLADQTLFATCLGTDSGPYEVRYMKTVNDVVTNGNTVYSTSSTEDDDDADDSLKKKLRITVVVLACFCFVLVVLVAASTNAMHNMHTARDAAKKANSGGPAVSMNPLAGDAENPGL